MSDFPQDNSCHGFSCDRIGTEAVTVTGGGRVGMYCPDCLDTLVRLAEEHAKVNYARTQKVKSESLASADADQFATGYILHLPVCKAKLTGKEEDCMCGGRPANAQFGKDPATIEPKPVVVREDGPLEPLYVGGIEPVHIDNLPSVVRNDKHTWDIATGIHSLDCPGCQAIKEAE